MYRRPSSPHNSRVATYLEALERDQTINSLRREYARHRTIEAEYDDLKYEISKAERENKKLEERNLEAQEDFMEKIKCNKNVITDLTEQIDQVEAKIRASAEASTQKQAKNEAIIEEIKLTKLKISECEEENMRLESQIQHEENVRIRLIDTIQELMSKKIEAQLENKTHSEAIDRQFQEFKLIQDRAKNQEQLNSQLRDQLTLLRTKKGKLLFKSQQSEQRIKQMKRKLDNAQYETEKLQNRCHEIDRQTSKLSAEAMNLKENIVGCLSKNKDHTAKLKNIEMILKDNVNSLSVKQSTRQKMLMEFSDLTKDVEKAEAILRVLDEETEEQEAQNKGLLANLKKSIQSDEEAVKALTRKAAILNLISQS